jgi:hypothetical protein
MSKLSDLEKLRRAAARLVDTIDKCYVGGCRAPIVRGCYCDEHKGTTSRDGSDRHYATALRAVLKLLRGAAEERGTR